MPFRWGPLIRLTTLFLIAAFAPSTVGAASYQKRDGTIVDPIMKYFYVSGVSRFVPAAYSGANLEPTADLTDANLQPRDPGLRGPDRPDVGRLLLHQQRTQLALEYGSILAGLGGHPGDFDLDGDVDGADFLLWQRNPSVGDLAD